MEGLRSEGLSAENPLEPARGPAHSEVGVGRGRRPGLSFVRRGKALAEEDSILGWKWRHGMTSPALPEVHLLRRPGHPAGHHEDKSPQTRRSRAQICSLRPRPGPAHARGQKQERVARGWDNGPRTQGHAGSLGFSGTKPPSWTRPVSPRTTESRSSRTLSRAPTCRMAKGRHPRSPQPSLRGRKE